MKREVMVLGIFVVLILSPVFIYAADETTQIDNAYSCLLDRINSSGCSKIGFEGQIFSLFAANKCQAEIMSDSINTSVYQCWPALNCDIKSTAQAVLALSESNINTTKGQNWLLGKTTTPSELEWFIEIETGEAASCDIGYSGRSYSLSVLENKKLSSSNLGNCLTLAQDNYWLKVSPLCYEMEIDISCKKDFLTALLFKKKDSSTVHVSDKTHDESAGGTTTEVVQSKCFGTSGVCDYQGSLWATLALYSMNYDVSSFIPYLTALREENSRYLPEAFLYHITGKFTVELLSMQKFDKYWDNSGDSYYDTALALWPLQNLASTEKSNSKTWLLKNQEESGCWDSGNIRNTAFILYSVWPRYFPDEPEIPGEPVCGNNNRETGEQCDLNDLNEKTCTLLLGNEWEGTLLCKSDCTFNYTLCTDIGGNGTGEYVCGNNNRETGEQCDGTDLNGKTCSLVLGNSYEGVLLCDDSCQFNSSGCNLKPGYCEEDSDCNYPVEECVSGICIDKTPIGNVECDENNPCPNGEECFGNICITPSILDCETDGGGFCMSQVECTGNIMYDYECSSVIFKCCSEDIIRKTCQQEGGIKCSSEEVCSGGVELNTPDLSFNEICCVSGTCKEDTGETPATSTCELNEGYCRTSCFSSEEENNFYSCNDYGDICCTEKTSSSGGSKGKWIIWVLLILIVLSAVGIIFREKLRSFFLKIKTRLKKGKSKNVQNRFSPSIIPPRTGLRRFLPRRIFPPGKPLSQGKHMPVSTKPPVQGVHSGKPDTKSKLPEKKRSGELDEVLKKLKEMGS